MEMVFIITIIIITIIIITIDLTEDTPSDMSWPTPYLPLFL